MENNYNGTGKFLEATLLCDFYTLSRMPLSQKSNMKSLSGFVARSNRYMPMAKEVVVFGVQMFIKKYLIDYFKNNFFERQKEDVVREYKRYIKHTLFIEDPDAQHISDLHDIGYLPIKIIALEEGTAVPFGVPVFIVENTKKEFFWLNKFIERLISSETWLTMTTASMAKAYSDILNNFAMETVGHTNDVVDQSYDFSMDGMSSLESGILSGMGHLLFFNGTSNIPVIMTMEKMYNANIEKELIASGVITIDHSAVLNSSGEYDSELFRYVINDVYPKGNLSMLYENYNLWKALEKDIPKMKEDIMKREGKIFISPNNGNSVSILCGSKYIDLSNDKYMKKLEDAEDWFRDSIYEDERTECGDGFHGEDTLEYEFKYEGRYYTSVYEIEYNRHDKRYYYIDSIRFKRIEEIFPSISDIGLVESLWDLFGGTVSKKGYKLLDSHIGIMCGGMTYDKVKELCERLKDKGFASINVTVGIGSTEYQYKTKNSLGFTMKDLNEEVFVYKDEEGNIVCKEGLVNLEDELIKNNVNLLKPVFIDGDLLREDNLADIRYRVKI